MEINDFIRLIKKLEKEKNKLRAVEQCKRMQDIAKKHNVPLIHIAEVYKQVLDSGIVNKQVLDKFKIDVNTNWNSNVSKKNTKPLNFDVKINNTIKIL